MNFAQPLGTQHASKIYTSSAFKSITVLHSANYRSNINLNYTLADGTYPKTMVFKILITSPYTINLFTLISLKTPTYYYLTPAVKSVHINLGDFNYAA